MKMDFLVSECREYKLMRDIVNDVRENCDHELNGREWKELCLIMIEDNYPGDAYLYDYVKNADWYFDLFDEDDMGE